MSVESTTTIAGLNALWPQGTDVKAEGDDHLRLIKSVLKADAVDKAQFATAVVATAQTRNRIVNGAMQVSQENGTTAGTSAGYFVADQWNCDNSATGSYSKQRVQVATPKGSNYRVRLTVTTGDATPTGYLRFHQPIEGIRVADFRYGYADAKQAVLRFGWKSPAGTYSVAIQNGAGSRSYIANFTISAGQANTDTEQVIVIPGDTTGAWPGNEAVCMYLLFCVAAHAAALGVAGWQAAGVIKTSANTNGAVAGAVYELFDVGLYLDPTNTGKPPPWQMPDEAQELAACQRYFQKVSLYVPAAGTYMNWYFKASMRTTPALSGGGAGFSGPQAQPDFTQVSQTTAAQQPALTASARM